MHRLDPRTKMLVFLGLGVAAAVVRTVPGIILLLCGGGAAVLFARPARGGVVGLLKILSVLAVGSLLLNALFTPGVKLPGPSWAPIWPTEAGVSDGVETALRLISMACIAFAIVATTSPKQLAEGVDSTLGKLSAFRGAGLAVNVACRFLPDIVQEAQRMRLVRSVRTRGRKTDLRSRFREGGSMMLGLVVIAVRKAERVADAMTARCYVSGAPRTTWRPREFTLADGVALAAAAALLACALLLGTASP